MNHDKMTNELYNIVSIFIWEVVWISCSHSEVTDNVFNMRTRDNFFLSFFLECKDEDYSKTETI